MNFRCPRGPATPLTSAMPGYYCGSTMATPTTLKVPDDLRARLAAQAEELAHLIADVLDAPNDEAVIARVVGEVKKLTTQFPVYGA